MKDMRVYPKYGMRYQQAIKTAIRHKSEGSDHIVQSMANQVRLAEGDKAKSEFIREVNDKGRKK